MDTTVPVGAALLLDVIAQTEVESIGRASYDVIYGHNHGKLSKQITSMTLGELIDAQASFTKRFKSSASGRYQFMRATLQGLAQELGLRGTQVFDRDLQDRLGYHDFISGKISRTEFGKRLAQEWEWFPVLAAVKGVHRDLTRGQSYYTGDPLNKALVTPAKIEAILNKVETTGSAQPAAEVVVEQVPVVADPVELGTKPSKSKTVWMWAGAAIMSAISGVGSYLGGLDWRVQLVFSVAIIGFAIYVIKRRADLFKAV